jgi:predicted RNase H-like nuclease (RuvC/YqgF family)
LENYIKSFISQKLKHKDEQIDMLKKHYDEMTRKAEQLEERHKREMREDLISKVWLEPYNEVHNEVANKLLKYILSKHL